MLSRNGPQIFFTGLALIWGTQQQPTMIQNFTGLIWRPHMGYNSPESNWQSDFDIFWFYIKKGLIFSELDSLYLRKRITPFSDHIDAIPLHVCLGHDFLISVIAVNLERTTVIFNLRKKYWLDVKTQICFPGSKFAFPRTWPWSDVILERGHVFSFSIFAIPMQICVFTYKGWQKGVIFSSFFLHRSTLCHYDQNRK